MVTLSMLTMMAVPAMAVDPCPPCGEVVVDLVAGQDNVVGTVTVTNDAEQICVTYALDQAAIDAGWLIYETHLAIGDELADIPQTKAKKKDEGTNPIPGNFAFHGDIDEEGTESYTECIDLDDPALAGVDFGECLFIAAHAVVMREDCELIAEADVASFISGTDTALTAGGYAIEAWQPYDPDNDTWDNGLIDDPFPDQAKWIWEAYRTVNPVDGDIVEFEKTFNIPGVPSSGHLLITCDNGYEAYLNDVLVGSAQLSGAWEASNLTQSFVDTNGWQTVEDWDVTGLLETGENTLRIIGVNEYMGPLDGQADGTIDSNPAGLKFKLCTEWDALYECTTDNQTAWGEGSGFNAKGNWGMYFRYNLCEPICDDPVVANGGFEYPVVVSSSAWDVYPSGTSGLGWTVEWMGSYAGAPATANLELQKSGAVGFAPDEGSQYAELDSDWNSASDTEAASIKIYQDINTCPGEKYEVSFAYSPRAGTVSTMEVYWNGSKIDDYSGSTQGWQTVTIGDLASSAGTATVLEFRETGTANSLGMFLDDVSVTFY
jgi:hypothetical protein